jgi:hypothetical protein
MALVIFIFVPKNVLLAPFLVLHRGKSQSERLEGDFIQVSESDGDEIRENGDAYLQKIKEKATSNKCLVYPSISMSSQEVKGESR